MTDLHFILDSGNVSFSNSHNTKLVYYPSSGLYLCQDQASHEGYTNIPMYETNMPTLSAIANARHVETNLHFHFGMNNFGNRNGYAVHTFCLILPISTSSVYAIGMFYYGNTVQTRVDTLFAQISHGTSDFESLAHDLCWSANMTNLEEVELFTSQISSMTVEIGFVIGNKNGTYLIKPKLCVNSSSFAAAGAYPLQEVTQSMLDNSFLFATFRMPTNNDYNDFYAVLKGGRF